MDFVVKWMEDREGILKSGKYSVEVEKSFKMYLKIWNAKERMDLMNETKIDIRGGNVVSKRRLRIIWKVTSEEKEEMINSTGKMEKNHKKQKDSEKNNRQIKKGLEF